MDRYLTGRRGWWPVVVGLAGRGPELRVEVRAEAPGPEGPAPAGEAGAELRAFLAADLRWNAATAARPGAGPLPLAVPEDHERVWSEATIPVDGRPVAFAWLAEGRHWVAHAEPYIQGTRRIGAARARRLGGDH